MKIPKLPKIDWSKLNTPTAYSTYAIIGVVTTTVLAIAITKKDCRKRYGEKFQGDIFEKQITKEEVIEEVKDAVKTYAPVLASTAATIFCIKKADQKWMSYNGLINASYLAARDKMARYRALAAPAVGAEVVKGLNGRRSNEDVEWFCIKDCPADPAGIPDVWPTGDFDFMNKAVEYHGGTVDIYFQSTKADVFEAEYHLNRNFALRSSASMREFFAFLGILDQFPEVFEDYLGWDAGVMIEDWGVTPWIDFEHWNTTDESTGEVINVICFTWEPCFTEDRTRLAWGYESGSGYCEQNIGGRPAKLSPTE